MYVTLMSTHACNNITYQPRSFSIKDLKHQLSSYIALSSNVSVVTFESLQYFSIRRNFFLQRRGERVGNQKQQLRKCAANYSIVGFKRLLQKVQLPFGSINIYHLLIVIQICQILIQPRLKPLPPLGISFDGHSHCKRINIYECVSHSPTVKP